MVEVKRTRAENRAFMQAEIERLARVQLETRGPAALSLREIARDLGVASSAVYRYVSDRDALLTVLIVDAYADLSRAVEEAVIRAGECEPRERLQAFASALRDWAVGHSAQWGLVYGTPVPGYAAPAAQTSGPGMRLMALLARIVADFEVSAAVEGAYRHYLETGARDLGLDVAPGVLALAVEAWCALVGTVSAEVFGQLGSDLTDVGDTVAAAAVAGLVARFSVLGPEGA